MALLVDYGLPSDLRHDEDAPQRKQFKAPELWGYYRDKLPTEESDIYAMGMTFYEVRKLVHYTPNN